MNIPSVRMGLRIPAQFYEHSTQKAVADSRGAKKGCRTAHQQRLRSGPYARASQARASIPLGAIVRRKTAGVREFLEPKLAANRFPQRRRTTGTPPFPDYLLGVVVVAWATSAEEEEEEEERQRPASKCRSTPRRSKKR